GCKATRSVARLRSRVPPSALGKERIMATPSLTERGLRDPQAVFETPEAVLACDQLPTEHKRAILERWRQLIGPRAPAREGDEGGPNLATRLFRALSFLDTETG